MNYAEPLVLSVSQLNRYVKARLDEDDNLYNIFLTGEISNFTRHFKTGHLYFSLKDETAAIKAVMFVSNASKLKFEPQNGLHVLVRGRVSLYEATGQYQLYVDDMQPEGIGALHLAFEQTKERLQKEGIFDASHKLPLPKFPQRIGVITSKVGAALQDILNILHRRYPLAEVVLAPARVQGEGAHLELIQAIAYLNEEEKPDVIILGRGGGSLEDLWEFNHEDLARAVYASKIPIISAVGHETDYTICDFAADLRAPTPSAAAELAVPDQAELRLHLQNQWHRMQTAIYTNLQKQKTRFTFLTTHSVLHEPVRYFDSKNMQLSTLSQRLYMTQAQRLAEEKAKLSALSAKLDALSPLAILGRGYVFAQKENHSVIQSITQLNTEENINLRFQDGSAVCVVKELQYETKTNL